jgi:ribosomal protein S18 acetylase RimI-like enzyme
VATPTRELSLRLELIEASAWKQIQRSVAAEFRERFGVSVRADAGTVRIHAPRTTQLAFNRVYALGVATPVNQARLDALTREFILAGSPRFLISWAPVAQPPDARRWFEERGFRRITGIARLTRRTEPDLDVASDLEVVVAGSRDAERFGATAALGNGLPPDFAPGFNSTMGHRGWRHYLALDGSRPVAAAALYVDGDIAWAGFAGTMPADRRRGAQSALLARRVRDAHAAGARWITCETTAESPERPNQSLRNMKRLGFEVTYELENYVLDFSVSPIA